MDAVHQLGRRLADRAPAGEGCRGILRHAGRMLRARRLERELDGGPGIRSIRVEERSRALPGHCESVLVVARLDDGDVRLRVDHELAVRIGDLEVGHRVAVAVGVAVQVDRQRLDRDGVAADLLPRQRPRRQVVEPAAVADGRRVGVRRCGARRRTSWCTRPREFDERQRRQHLRRRAAREMHVGDRVGQLLELGARRVEEALQPRAAGARRRRQRGEVDVVERRSRGARAAARDGSIPWTRASRRGARAARAGRRRATAGCRGRPAAARARRSCGRCRGSGDGR